MGRRTRGVLFVLLWINMFQIIIASVVVAASTFAVQMLIFRKTARKILRLIPLFVVGLLYTAAIILFTLDFFKSGGYLFNTLIALIISSVGTAMLVADAVAWLVEKV